MTRARFQKPLRERLRDNRRSLDELADLLGKPRLPIGFLGEEPGPKRASPVRDETRISEADVNDMIRGYSAMRDDLVLWRNNRGEVILPNGQHLRYGVGPNGASDWIGYRTVRVTSDMVGMKIAQFVAAEAKAPDAPDPTDSQIRFIDRVNASGGVALVVRERKDVEKL